MIHTLKTCKIIKKKYKVQLDIVFTNRMTRLFLDNICNK